MRFAANLACRVRLLRKRSVTEEGITEKKVPSLPENGYGDGVGKPVCIGERHWRG